MDKSSYSIFWFKKKKSPLSFLLPGYNVGETCSFDENFYLITIFQFWSNSSVSDLTHHAGLKNEREPEEKDGSSAMGL